MKNRLEDLWKTSSSEGASSPIGIEVFRPRVEMEDLLHAWARERGQCIEMGMMLEQSRRLIRRLLAVEGLSKEDRKRARALVALIRMTLRDADSNGT